MLLRMQRNWITHLYIAGTAKLENILAVSYKSKHASTIQFSNCTSMHLTQRNEDVY